MTDRSPSAGVSVVLRRFGPMIYGPTVLFSLGEGVLIPLLPILAHGMGANVAVSAAVAAMLVVGQLCGNIPAGWAVARIGERMSMMVGGAAAIAGTLGLVFSPNLGVMTISVFVLGFCAAIFALARQTFMTTRVPLVYRARALSLLGGSFRLGTFVGPFIAAGLLFLFHSEAAAIWFAIACLVGVVVMVLVGQDPEHVAGAELDRFVEPPQLTAEEIRAETEDTGEAVSGSIPTTEHTGVWRTMWNHRGVLLRLGMAASALSAVRSARQVVLPLWGVSIGLDAQTIALVVGISGAIDFALFYFSGQVMDRYGRLWAALPAMLLMGGGFVALAFTHDGGLSEMWFALFSAVLGVGNGLSSGILLTLGADVAPRTDPAPFLGSWRTLTDAGGAVAPLVVSAVTAISTLSLATGVVGLIGLVGAWGFIRWVPRFVPHDVV